MMSSFAQLVLGGLKAGGWAPLLVFSLHVVLGRGLHAYDVFPSIDVPMHILGGVAIAMFVSGSFRRLPRAMAQASRVIVLECVLIVSLTATAAVLWEFAEFSLDQLTGSNVQVSLPNTMKDLAMGLTGATIFAVSRLRQTGRGLASLRELAADCRQGLVA